MTNIHLGHQTPYKPLVAQLHKLIPLGQAAGHFFGDDGLILLHQFVEVDILEGAQFFLVIRIKLVIAGK